VGRDEDAKYGRGVYSFLQCKGANTEEKKRKKSSSPGRGGGLVEMPTKPRQCETSEFNERNVKVERGGDCLRSRGDLSLRGVNRGV